MRTALVAGATGLVGSALVERLVGAGGYDAVHLLLRRELPQAGTPVVQHVVDFDRLDQLDLGGKIDNVFCALGTTIRKAGSQQAFRRVDLDYVVALGRLAVRHRADSLSAVSSVGADPRARGFYLRVKGEMEEALRALDLPRLALVRPSLLTGSRAEFRFGERLGEWVMTPLAPLMLGPLRKLRPISAELVAEAMRRAALQETGGVQIYEGDAIRRLADPTNLLRRPS